MINDIVRGLNMATTSGLLTATGGVTTYDTTVTIQYMINGKFETAKTAVTTGTTPTTDYVTSAAFPLLIGGGSVANTPGQGAVVVWGLIAGGTVVCMQGPICNLDMQGKFKHDGPEFPTVPSNVTPFAYQVLKAGATASASGIRFGTSNWNATGFTNAIRNVGVLPNRPQVA